MELAAIERQGRGIGTVGCDGFPTGFRDVVGLEVTGPRKRKLHFRCYPTSRTGRTAASFSAERNSGA